MRVWVVSNVVHESGEAEVFLVFIACTHSFQDSLHHFEHAQAVSESGMRCVRVYEISHLQLFQLSETLKRWRVNDLPFGSTRDDVSVHVVDDELSLDGTGRFQTSQSWALQNQPR